MTALQLRDEAWVTSDLIPSWVRGREVSFDQHNTQSSVSKYCWQSFQKILKADKKSINEYKIIEPSAGTGSFYELLPKETGSVLILKNSVNIKTSIYKPIF